ncbi:hypothetical protein D3C80_1218240 [compost metagenome]
MRGGPVDGLAAVQRVGPGRRPGVRSDGGGNALHRHGGLRRRRRDPLVHPLCRRLRDRVGAVRRRRLQGREAVHDGSQQLAGGGADGAGHRHPSLHGHVGHDHPALRPPGRRPDRRRRAPGHRHRRGGRGSAGPRRRRRQLCFGHPVAQPGRNPSATPDRRRRGRHGGRARRRHRRRQQRPAETGRSRTPGSAGSEAVALGRGRGPSGRRRHGAVVPDHRRGRGPADRAGRQARPRQRRRGHDLRRARSARPSGPGTPHRPSGPQRQPDRPAEPRLLPGAPDASDRHHQAGRDPGSVRPGPEPLQGGQRPLRPRGRRPASVPHLGPSARGPA